MTLPERFIDRGVIAEGGIGTVRSVFDTVLRRELAVKMLRPALSTEPSWEASFVDEAQITAQLTHPGIVPVHDLVTDDSGTPYFTMKQIRGKTLGCILQEDGATNSSGRLVELLEVLMRVCDALAFAHSRGVVHRDIKPSNIMVGEFGEVYLMDWGLAKLKSTSVLDVDREHNGSAAAKRVGPMGTPSYMSPEQAGGIDAEVDERSDIFSLGAVLYHIVTGVPPYGNDSTQGVVFQAMACHYTPPGDASSTFVPRLLCSILAKALAREPRERYQSVTEFKHDLRRFMHGGLHLPRMRFASGAQIIREGDPGDAAYLITHGQCDVYKMTGPVRRFIRRMGPGTVFGEMAVLSNAPRTATVEAVGDVTVLVLDRSVIEEGLGPETWESKLVGALVERFREIDERLTEIERQRLDKPEEPETK